MLHTIKEAKEKACPIMSSATTKTIRDPVFQCFVVKSIAKCEADECMMWQWETGDIYSKQRKGFCGKLHVEEAKK